MGDKKLSEIYEKYYGKNKPVKNEEKEMSADTKTPPVVKDPDIKPETKEVKAVPVVKAPAANSAAKEPTSKPALKKPVKEPVAMKSELTAKELELVEGIVSDAMEDLKGTILKGIGVIIAKKFESGRVNHAMKMVDRLVDIS